MANSSVVIDITANTKPAEKEIKDLKDNIKNEKVEFEFDDIIDEKELKRIDLLIEKEKRLDHIRRASQKYKETYTYSQADTQKTFGLGGNSERLDYYKNLISQETAKYQELNAEISSLNAKTSQTTTENVAQTQEVTKQVQEEKKVGQEIDKNKTKHQQVNNTTKQHNFNLGDIIKKVTRWGLAIFGVRSAYMGIRRAISMVSSRSKEVNEKMEQMQNVIASAIAPLVKTIVNLLMKAMVYVNYITWALFHKKIFDFSQATKFSADNMKKTAKSAKEINKQLAGFDEMNVLQDNKTGSGAGVNDGYSADWFKGLENIKIPDWLVKVTGWIKSAIDWFKKLDPVLQGLLGTIALVLGVGLKVGGGSGLLGLASILGKLATIGVIAIGVDLIYSHLTGRDLYTDLKTIYDFLKNNTKIEKDNTEMHNNNAKATSNLSKKKKDLAKQQGKNSEAVQEYTNYLLDQIKQEKQMADQEGTSITDKARHMAVIEDLIKDYQDLYEQGLLNNEQEEIFKRLMLEASLNGDDLAYTINNLQGYNGKMQSSQKEVNKQIEKLATDFGLSKEGASNLKDALYEYNTSTEDSETKTKKLYEEIEKIGKKSGLSKEEIERLKKKLGELPANKEINVKVNKPSDTELKKIGSKIGNAINSGFNSVVDLALNVTGKTKGQRKGALIKYAKGGIINRPAKGVPLAIGGEAGREGVVPLTDSQQMALLGEAIGKYITINANITNTMNGRVLSRELQKIQNEEAFGSNRW